MISARDFILSYSQWFSYIAEHHGHEAVEELWAAISDEFLLHFRKLIEEKGFEGMVEHWSRTLKEEQADCDIKYENDEFQILMHNCPSVSMVRDAKWMKKYPRYCEHCFILYERVIKDYGFDFNIDYLDQEKGVCRIIVRKSENNDEK